MVVDVRGHHIGLHAIDPRLVRVVGMVVGQQHAQHPVGHGGVPGVDQRQQQPKRPVGILAAVLPHPRRIAPDVARVDAASLEGRRQQANDPRLFIDELLPGRLQRHAAARPVQPGQLRPGLGDGVDAALGAIRAAQLRAVVGIRPQIPAAVPAVFLQRISQSCREPGQPGPVRLLRRDRPVAVRAGHGELGQPNALAPALRAQAVHAVVPVPRSHQQQPVRPEPRRRAEGRHAVFAQAGQSLPGPHFPVHILRAVGQRHVLQIGHPLLQHAAVPGVLHIRRRHPGQEQPVVGHPRAHARTGCVPPMQHVPGLELPAGAAQQVCPHPPRLAVQQRQHVLELIPEAPRAAGLAEPRAAQHPGCADLVEQEAVGEGVQRGVRRLYGQPLRLPRRLDLSRSQRAHPRQRRPGVLRPAQRQPQRPRLAPLQSEGHAQRPALAAGIRGEALRGTGIAPAEEGAAARSRLGQGVRDGKVARAVHRAFGQAGPALPAAFQRHGVPAVRAHQPVHMAPQPERFAPQAPVFQPHVDQRLRKAVGHGKARLPRGAAVPEGEGYVIPAEAHPEGVVGPLPGQQPQHLAPGFVHQVQHQAPALPLGVVAVGRQPPGPAVAPPEEAAAPLGQQQPAGVVGQQVAPRRRRQPTRRDVDLIAPVGQEAAVAVVGQPRSGLKRARPDVHGSVCAPPRPPQRRQQPPDLGIEFSAPAEGGGGPAQQRTPLLPGQPVAVQQPCAARHAPQAVQVARGDQRLQRVPQRPGIAVAAVVHQHEVDLDSRGAVEFMGADQLPGGVRVHVPPRPQHEQRQVAGDAQRPEGLLRGRSAASPAPGLGRQRAVEQQRRQLLQRAVPGGVQSDEAQQGPRPGLREAQDPLRLPAIPPARQPFSGVRVPVQQRQREAHPRRLSRLQGQLQPQGAGRVQQVARPAGQGPPQALPRVPISPRQRLPIALPGDLSGTDGQVGQPRSVRAPAPRPAAQQQPAALQRATCDKQVLECRVGPPVPLRGQRHGHDVRQRQPRRQLPRVAQLDHAKQRAVLRGQARAEPRLDAVQLHRAADFAGGERPAGVRLAQRQRLPGVQVGQPQPRRAGPVLERALKAGGAHAVLDIVHRAVVGPERRRAAAGQQMGLGREGLRVGPAVHARLRRQRAVRGRIAAAPGTRVPAGALLQQRRERPGFRLSHKVPGQGVAREGVAQGAQRHALVVGHVAFHQRGPVPAGVVQVVGGLIQPPFVRPAHVPHALQVPGGGLRSHHRRQRRGIGRDHAVHGLPVQRQRPQPEGAVLIVQRRVQGVVAGLRNAPGPVRPPPLGDLRRHGGAHALAQQRVRRHGHQQLRHHIFKHRSGPAQRRDAPGKPDAASPQPAPVAGRHLAQQHGREAEDAGLGGQQIVVGRAGPARLRVHADAEQLPVPVVQRRKVHLPRQRPQPVRQLRPDLRRVGAQQQRRGQVAAVHGGDIAGPQRGEGIDVVPVVQVAAPLLQPPDVLQRGGHAALHFGYVNEAQPPRGEAAEQVQRDVGGRGAPGRTHGRVQLHVVRGQRRVACGHVVREEAPGVPGQLEEDVPLAGGVERLLRAVMLHVPDPARAREEQRGQRQRHEAPPGGQQPGNQQQRRHPPGQGDIHAPAPLGVRGGHPLHQLLPGDAQPPQRAQHGVQAAPGEGGQRRQPRGGPAPQAFPCGEIQQRLQVVHDQRRQQHVAAARPGGADQQAQQRGGLQRSDQVVQHAEPVRSGEPSPVGKRAPAQQQRQQLPVAPGPAVQPGQEGGQAARIAVVEGDVPRKARPGDRAFDQVMAEDAPLGQRALQRPGEGGHVVDALSGVDAAARGVLPEV